ncbi:FAD-dependent oxidoreductase [Novosphingobium percolationis]|uniref:FAD-dependent oxidoreductase n=1 Tax=Novosphingobium percolationis TaxID=2871811 RepID=UPI001CD2F66E|nr:FAD-dependent oxidoreductase [Novosphingobium percolationis]
MPVHEWNAFPESLLASGLLIVGSGAVGLAMAAHLAQLGVPVTVLEGGPPTPPADWQDRNAGPCTGLPHGALSVARMKAFGGTSRLWHGQLLPLSRRDLADWPLAYEDYRTAVAQALELLGVSPREADSDGVWRRSGRGEPLLGHGLRGETGALLPQPDFTRLFARAIASPLVQIVTGAEVAGLAFAADGRIEGVEARLGDRTQLFRAREVVLACGTLDIARLLMRAQTAPHCPFAANAHVGRWFIDHLHGVAGRLENHDRAGVAALFEGFTLEGRRHTAKVRLDDAALAPGEASVALSFEAALSLWEVKQEAAGLWRRVSGRRAGVLAALRESFGLLRVLLPIAWRYVARRGLVGLGKGPLLLMAEIEQRPHPDSRMVLDAQGRAGVHWTIGGRAEIAGLARAADALKALLRDRRLGDVALEPLLEARDPTLFEAMWDNAHQCGGARMAASADDGVTDPAGRVFGCANLSVAGAATFPSGGFANVTLSAIALGLRVADRIAPAAPLMPRLVYGAARLDGGALAARSARVLRQALDAGVGAVDVGPSYGLGLAETVVGQVLRDPAFAHVDVFAKLGSRRDPLGRWRSVPRALKRSLRWPAPAPRDDFAPMEPVDAFGWGDFTPDALRKSHAIALSRLGRIDRLLLHECGPAECGLEQAAVLTDLATRTGARPGIAITPAWDAAIQRRYPTGWAIECAIHPDILTGAMEVPAEVVFHSITPTVRWLARHDRAFAAALEEAAQLIPAPDPQTARIAAGLALAAARAPTARLVFSSTHPERLTALLDALVAIDRQALLPTIAACFSRG